MSQTRQSLENAGIIEMEAHPLDARQRHLVLTNAGVKLIGRLQPLWQAMEAAALEVDVEAGNAVAALDRLDEVLARQSLFERILAKLSNAPQSSRNSRSKNRSTIS